MNTHKRFLFKFLSLLLILAIAGGSWGTTLAAPRKTTVSKTVTITFNKPADVWQGRSGVYFSTSAYTGEVTLTRKWTDNKPKMGLRLGQQHLKLRDRYLDFQLETFAGTKVNRLFGLVYVYFNLYPSDLKLWRNGELAIYTYDTDNQKWVECTANHLVRKGPSSYRLACIATQTGVFALVQILD